MRPDLLCDMFLKRGVIIGLRCLAVHQCRFLLRHLFFYCPSFAIKCCGVAFFAICV